MKDKFRCSIIMLTIALSCFAIASCEKPTVFEDEDLLNSLYQKAQDTIAFKNSEYVLETSLYRDLMPGGPIPKDRPLISILYLTNIDSLDVSDEMNLDRVYIINENLIYRSTPEYREDDYLPNYEKSYICWDGPEWETGIVVNVIVKLISESTNETHYLISKDQQIEKVE